MMRRMLVLCLFLAAVTALCTACGNNNLLDGAENNLQLYRWDGEQTLRYWVCNEDAAPVIRALRQNKAKAVENWSVEQADTPCYGLEISTADGWGIQALWTNGYWIDQEGQVWNFDFDFEQLIRETRWTKAEAPSDFRALSCIRYLAQNGERWNTEYLESAPEDEPPADISMTNLQKAGECLTVTLTNDSATEWTYGRYWHFEVLAEDHWYIVPELPGNWAFTDLGYLLPSGENRTEIFYLRENTYGDLPPGQYRLVFYGMTVEFTLE